MWKSMVALKIVAVRTKVLCRLLALLGTFGASVQFGCFGGKAGGVEILVRGFNLHRPKEFVGRPRANMLVGNGHHEHLLASIDTDVEAI
jgi:hypothetical protein